MNFFIALNKTKYMWNTVIADRDNDNEWVAYSSHKTMEEAEAWGEGFIKAIQLMEMIKPEATLAQSIYEEAIKSDNPDEYIFNCNLEKELLTNPEEGLIIYLFKDKSQIIVNENSGRIFWVEHSDNNNSLLFYK